MLSTIIPAVEIKYLLRASKRLMPFKKVMISFSATANATPSIRCINFGCPPMPSAVVTRLTFFRTQLGKRRPTVRNAFSNVSALQPKALFLPFYIRSERISIDCLVSIIELYILRYTASIPLAALKKAS